jgi:hypothetical protein
VDSEGSVGLYSSLAVDKDGYPHISYFYHTGTDIQYAYRNASGWHIQSVADVGSYYTGWSSLALDEGEYPHISYYTYFGDDLKYAYQDASGWNIEP